MSQHRLAPLVYLYLPQAFHPGPLEAEIKPADPGEQATEGQCHLALPPLSRSTQASSPARTPWFKTRSMAQFIS